MKKLYLIGVVCFLLFNFQTSFSQEKINQFNSGGKRTGVWKKNFNNGKIRYIGQFKNGKEIGVFKFYSPINSKYPTAIKTFEANTNLAKVSFYTVEGVLVSKGLMDGKKRIGHWTYYQPDGKTLLSEENYKNGVLEGKSVTYYKSGKVAEVLSYKNDKLHGNSKRFAKNGVLLDDLNYVNGKLDGLAKYYDIHGKLIYTGNYKDDMKVGKWEYFENGKSVSIDKLKQ